MSNEANFFLRSFAAADFVRSLSALTAVSECSTSGERRYFSRNIIALAWLDLSFWCSADDNQTIETFVRTHSLTLNVEITALRKLSKLLI